MSGDRPTNHAVGHKAGDDNWMGYLKSTVANYLPYALPTQVTDVFTQGRAFASAVLPQPGIKHYCAITTVQKSLRSVVKTHLCQQLLSMFLIFRLLVASQSGYMYVYSIPLDGGECQLINKHGELGPSIHRSFADELSFKI